MRTLKLGVLCLSGCFNGYNTTIANPDFEFQFLNEKKKKSMDNVDTTYKKRLG